jgi:uncharacterized protein (DUF697 family)
VERIGEADAIIQQHVGYAMAAAAIPVPLADVAAVMLVQLDMVKALSRRYAVDYDASRSNALLISLVGASVARIGASALKSIPVAGTLIGVAAQIALSGAATYAAGHVFRGLFEDTGSLEGADADQLRARYEAYVERGRRLARNLRDRSGLHVVDDSHAAASHLERLERLRRTGVISDAEFERLTEDWAEADDAT